MHIRFAIMMAFLLFASSARADDAQQVFDSLYGQRIKAAIAQDRQRSSTSGAGQGIWAGMNMDD